MVNTIKVTAEVRLAHWAQTIRDKNESGLSVEKFCEERGIGRDSYFYYQKKLRARATYELLSQQPTNPEPTAPPMNWAVCEVAPTNADKTLPIEINGCRILASADTDSELLAKTCKVLMSLC